MLTVGLEGSVTASYGDPNNPLFVGVDSVTLNFVDPLGSSIDMAAPALVSVSANVYGGIESWKSPFTWPLYDLLIVSSAQALTDYSDGSSATVSAAGTDLENTLQGAGPTDQPVPIPLDSFFPFPISLTLNLVYDVTIPKPDEPEPKRM
jgi:hypothetical protein